MIISNYVLATGGIPSQLVGGIIGLVVILVVIILMTGYVKASPDTAYIISGFRKQPKYLIGKAGIKIPFFEKKDELSLKLIPIDVKTASSVPTADYINVNVDAAVNIKISDDPSKLKLAAQNFLNKDINYIGNVAKNVLEGNTREIVGKMKLQEMVSDRQKFGLLVKENAEPDLAAMGLDIVSFNVQNFIDENQVIENLGIDNIVQIKKSASIARAEGERDIQIAQAKANKEANDARIESEREIAERNNELDIKKSELKKIADIKKAEADAAYSIQEEEQRKTVETTKAQADIAKQEQYIVLKQKEAAVKEQALDAEIKKKAEAEKFATQQAADADLYQRMKDAEARKYELEQEAAGIRAKGIAEAEAIRAKAVAEAEGIEKKAEAMQKYGEAAILEMFFKAFPEAVKNAAEPIASVDSITMYGSGNNEQLVGSVMNTVNQVTDGIKGSTGLDIKNIIGGYVGDVAPKATIDKEQTKATTKVVTNSSSNVAPKTTVKDVPNSTVVSGTSKATVTETKVAPRTTTTEYMETVVEQVSPEKDNKEDVTESTFSNAPFLKD